MTDPVEKATKVANDAQIAADEAQRKADEANANKTPEQKAADAAAQKADDARAKAAELAATAETASATPTLAADAGVLAALEPDLTAGHYRAQKFGNDPANPQPAPGIDLNANLVKISRKTPDVPGGKVYDEVPKEMVGDYERAGWNRDA